MDAPDLAAISAYVMPEVPLRPSDVGFLFGTRHGVDEFCASAHALWMRGMFRVLLVSGGVTPGDRRPEAEVIAARLLALGMPRAALVLETRATNTGENVILGRAALSARLDLAQVRSVLVIGKVCATRRYLMTIERHWPGLALSACPVNYFGVEVGRWHEHREFRRRVLAEYQKIPGYLEQGFLSEVADYAPYPARSPAP
ncbi:YdcF family protein [Massilia niastensis]|uniref:YdcF family protein n=1 Tax=Massilia niastensis TaxID=544911 RepID=UPI0003670764|nr:YdcF family protein [Massilia niastensis]